MKTKCDGQTDGGGGCFNISHPGPSAWREIKTDRRMGGISISPIPGLWEEYGGGGGGEGVQADLFSPPIYCVSHLL